MNVTLKSEVLTVSLNPERGNIITELILGGVNHIYLDQENLKSGQRAAMRMSSFISLCGNAGKRRTGDS